MLIRSLLPAIKAYGGFSAPIKFDISPSLGRLGALEVRLAQTAAEVRRAQKLRYRVFYQQGGATADAATRLARHDSDAYDTICDHLLVIDHSAGTNGSPRASAVVGT